jgi:transposase-like protein
VAAHFAEVYGAKVSKDTISKITDKVVAEMTEWQNRPLDRVYPVLFIDAIVVKVRDEQVTNRPFDVVIGVTVNGERDILGIWAGDGSEGAKFWLGVLTDIKNRRVEDVCMVVCDGLKGLPESITTAWTLAQVRICLLHLIRNTFRYASRKDWEAIARDLKPIYTAANEPAAKARFDEFAEVWGAKYPAIIGLWRSAWSEFVPFLDYGACYRIACRPGRERVSTASLFEACSGRCLRVAAWAQVAGFARWTFMMLNAVAARCSSLVALSRPRRANRSMIFFRFPIPGSTVAPRHL